MDFQYLPPSTGAPNAVYNAAPNAFASGSSGNLFSVLWKNATASVPEVNKILNRYKVNEVKDRMSNEFK